MCLANCSFCQYKYSGKSNLGTFLKYGSFLRLIFSVFIYIIRVLAALLRSLYSFSVFLLGLRQIVYNFFSIFSLDQTFFHSTSILYLSASLMVSLTLSSIYLSVVYSESYSLHFSIFFFAFLYPIAFLAATSTSLFFFISIYASIQ